ncbi:MAG: RuBisCO large subunit C-terminal-like domain-containing protein [bacterium]
MTSKKRFSVLYSITGSKKEVADKAFAICVEQTIEFPYHLVKDKYIKDTIVGKIESIKTAGKKHLVEISYANETAGTELTQFLNVVFGNTSMTPGIRVEKMFPPSALLNKLKGPRFGAAGLKRITGIYNRPLLCSALKPMGTTISKLAELSYKFALGGIDIIKDDHGLANQGFSPFKERVTAVCEAVNRANKKTGFNTLYAPNITADGLEAINRAKFAKRQGAGALIISPGLAGLETMRTIVEDDSIGLPLFYHPAFHGSYFTNPDSGLSPYAFFGQLTRMCGADATIFPNFGGRFSFTEEECSMIAKGCKDKLGKLKALLPAPGGGVTMDKLSHIKSFYGNDAVLLMGGGLFSTGIDITENCKEFKRLVSLKQ